MGLPINRTAREQLHEQHIPGHCIYHRLEKDGVIERYVIEFEMTVDLKWMLESKEALRRKPAMHDVLRGHAPAIHDAAESMRYFAVHENPVKYQSGQNTEMR